jgi:hypothetical protein
MIHFLSEIILRWRRPTQPQLAQPEEALVSGARAHGTRDKYESSKTKRGHMV